MKFSIAIPAYKGKYLCESILSVISQSYSDLELIILNDNSPDNLDSIVESFQDERIKYYKNKENCGALNVVDNWNKCLSLSSGDYFICMGDDDKLDFYCLEEYNYLIEKYPSLGVYHGRAEIINEESEFVSVTSERPEYESVYSLIWNRFDNRNRQFIGDFLFDRKLLQENGGFFKLPFAWCSDDITVTIAANKSGIANTSRIVFQYRDCPETISRGNFSLGKLQALDIAEQWFDSFLFDRAKDEISEKYRISAQGIIKTYFRRIRIYQVAKDLKTRCLSGLFFWFFKHKQYKLSFKELIYSFILSKR